VAITRSFFELLGFTLMVRRWLPPRDSNHRKTKKIDAFSLHPPHYPPHLKMKILSRLLVTLPLLCTL
jgi:hypothetical protein